MGCSGGKWCVVGVNWGVNEGVGWETVSKGSTLIRSKDMKGSKGRYLLGNLQSCFGSCLRKLTVILVPDFCLKIKSLPTLINMPKPVFVF